jgi:S-DNA-T family DNA segregation ATPase FtsK/SpoIIIE
MRKSNLRARWMVAGTAALLVVGPVLMWTVPYVLSGIIGFFVFWWTCRLIPGKSPWEYVVAAGLGVAAGLVLPVQVFPLLPPPPWWVLPLVLVPAVLGLGWYGKPKAKALVKPIELQPHHIEPLRAPVVTEALCELGNARMKEPSQIRLLSDPVRSGQGYQMDLELPRGVAASWVIERREQFASGIRRELGCVFLSVGSRHPAHLVVYVSDLPMAQQTQEPWPLLKAGKVDIFRPVPMFTDSKGDWVNLTFAYASMVVGALPRMGKSFLLRQALLVAGLDPRTRVYALDGKGEGGLAACQLFAHFYSRGKKPEEIERVRAMVRELREDLVRRADFIDSLSREECPESKVTSALASKYPQLRPVVVGVDETQSYFLYGDNHNKEHRKIRDELAAGITELVKLGPALGVHVFLASQNVNKDTIPRSISTNAAFRCCLKVADQVENDQILGTSAYSQGVNACQFDYEDKGILFLRADGTQPRIVRTVANLDALASESVAARARSYREEQGTLSGDAAGEKAEAEEQQIVFLEDARFVMDAPGEDGRNMSLERMRTALSDLRTGVYSHLDNEALGGMLRGAGITPASVWCPAEGRTMRGVKRSQLDVAATDDAEQDGGSVTPLRA